MLFRWFNKLNDFLQCHTQSLSVWSSIVTIVSFPLVVVGLFLGYFEVKDVLIQPSVELQLTSPASALYTVENTSEKIAEDVLISFGIFDLDSSKNPVPIPGQNFEYINKLSGRGPMSVLGKLGINGHCYFGIIYLGCRGCDELKTYWVYLKQGGGMNESFYAKRNYKDTFEINMSRLLTDRDKYLEELVPSNRRIYIH